MVNLYYKSFNNMIERAKRLGVSCDFTYGSDQLDRFIKVIGPVPDDMLQPSVGRHDHTKGYVVGNAGYQRHIKSCRGVQWVG